MNLREDSLSASPPSDSPNHSIPHSFSTGQLAALLAARAAESHALKGALRQAWTRPMAEEQRALARLRRRITDLCVLRAHLRGRYHLQHAPREGAAADSAWDRDAWHADAATRVARELGLALPATATARASAHGGPK